MNPAPTSSNTGGPDPMLGVDARFAAPTARPGIATDQQAKPHWVRQSSSAAAAITSDGMIVVRGLFAIDIDRLTLA